MRKLIVVFIFGLLINNQGYSFEPQNHSEYQNGIGATVGVPYIIGILYERSLTQKFSVQSHVGYFVYFSSLGARINWFPINKNISPYLFAGDALIKSRAEDGGDPEGVANYLWFGPGLKYSYKHFKIFVEVCGLVGGNNDKGIGADWIFPFDPAIGGGLIFRF